MRNKLPKSKRALKEYWTFRNESRKKFTHALHKYPARMHPEIAKNIIAKYAESKRTVIIDPFVGSGGVLIESMLKKKNSIGFDVNPFAVLLAKVKTTIINPKRAECEYQKILEKSKKDYQRDKFYPKLVPTDFDVEFWNKPSVIKKLSILKKQIFKSKDRKMSNFLKICFSLTVRHASNQRRHEFKHWRLEKEQLKKYRPDVFKIFSDICETNCNLMASFKTTMRGNKTKAVVKFGNAVNLSDNFNKINSEFLDDAKRHLVITSPPYGDHSTTVAYGEFSYHSGSWLDLPVNRLKEVDRVCLGGQRYDVEMSDLESPKLTSQLRAISKIDTKRAEDVYAFFFDFDKCLEELSKILKNNSHLCFVVGNRTVKRIPIHTDKILVQLALKYGFKHIATYPRMIPTKVLPFKNAPENISNKAGRMMSEERIVILKN